MRAHIDMTRLLTVVFRRRCLVRGATAVSIFEELSIHRVMYPCCFAGKFWSFCGIFSQARAVISSALGKASNFRSIDPNKSIRYVSALESAHEHVCVRLVVYGRNT